MSNKAAEKSSGNWGGIDAEEDHVENEVAEDGGWAGDKQEVDDLPDVEVDGHAQSGQDDDSEDYRDASDSVPDSVEPSNVSGDSEEHDTDVGASEVQHEVEGSLESTYQESMKLLETMQDSVGDTDHEELALPGEVTAPDMDDEPSSQGNSLTHVADVGKEESVLLNVDRDLKDEVGEHEHVNGQVQVNDKGDDTVLDESETESLSNTVSKEVKEANSSNCPDLTEGQNSKDTNDDHLVKDVPDVVGLGTDKLKTSNDIVVESTSIKQGDSAAGTCCDPLTKSAAITPAVEDIDDEDKAALKVSSGKETAKSGSHESLPIEGDGSLQKIPEESY